MFIVNLFHNYLRVRKTKIILDQNKLSLRSYFMMFLKSSFFLIIGRVK